MRLFAWPQAGVRGLLAVLQYKFEGSNPAGSCWSVGLVAYLMADGPGWRVKDRYLLDAHRHTRLYGVEMADLSGDSVPERIVEWNTGWAGGAGSILSVFDLGRGKLDEVFNRFSRMEHVTESSYVQHLDRDRTLQAQGARFCFTQTTCVQNSRVLSPPRIDRPCYQRGLEFRSSCQRWLEPLR